MASQIHMAGRTSTRVRRQLENSSFTPWNSMTNAPTTKANGANIRRDRLRSSTAFSTVASSSLSMARTNALTRSPITFRSPAALSQNAG